MKYKIHLKLVRHFALGFTVLSPKLNGLCIHIHISCFDLCFWSRGEQWIKFSNFWNG